MGRGQSEPGAGIAAPRGNSMFPRETMIRYHLEHNIYPPIGFGESGAVEFATKAIDAVNEGDPQRLVEVTVESVPDPAGDPTVWQGHAGMIVAEWKLEHLLEAETDDTAVAAAEAERHCKLCGRLLDVPGDEDSVDCGGDCWGCMRVIEAGMADDDTA